MGNNIFQRISVFNTVSDETLASRINTVYRIIPAVGKHVIAKQALAGGYQCIRIKESAHLWVVVSGLQIIQAGIFVIDIAAVAQGVGVHPCAVGHVLDIAPCVVGVDAVGFSACVHQPNHIALLIQNVEYHPVVIPHGTGLAVLVIVEGHNDVAIGFPEKFAVGIIVGMDDTVHHLGGAKTVGTVGIADIGGSIGSRCQLPPMLPGEGPPGAVIVAGGIADGIVGNGFAIVSRQQVTPACVAVGVGMPSGILGSQRSNRTA